MPSGHHLGSRDGAIVLLSVLELRGHRCLAHQLQSQGIPWEFLTKEEPSLWLVAASVGIWCSLQNLAPVPSRRTPRQYISANFSTKERLLDLTRLHATRTPRVCTWRLGPHSANWPQDHAGPLPASSAGALFLEEPSPDFPMVLLSQAGFLNLLPGKWRGFVLSRLNLPHF